MVTYNQFMEEVLWRQLQRARKERADLNHKVENLTIEIDDLTRTERVLKAEIAAEKKAATPRKNPKQRRVAEGIYEVEGRPK